MFDYFVKLMAILWFLGACCFAFVPEEKRGPRRRTYLIALVIGGCAVGALVILDITSWLPDSLYRRVLIAGADELLVLTVLAGGVWLFGKAAFSAGAAWLTLTLAVLATIDGLLIEWARLSVVRVGGFVIAVALIVVAFAPGFRRVRRALETGNRGDVIRAIATILGLLYAAAIMAAGVIAAIAHVSLGAALQQVGWEYARAVPVVDLTDGWARPVDTSAHHAVEIALVPLRLVALAAFVPAVVALAQRATATNRAGDPAPSVPAAAAASNAAAATADSASPQGEPSKTTPDASRHTPQSTA